MFYRDGDVPSPLRKKEDARVIERLCDAPWPKSWGVKFTQALVKPGEKGCKADEKVLFLNLKPFGKIF
jgi:hypothetical protein